MSAIHTPWQRIQNILWIVCGLLSLFFALVFWAISDQQEEVTIVKEPESEVELHIQPEKVASTRHLGAMLDEVKPIEMIQRVVATGDHGTEFRGTKFIEEHKRNYTIELFRVTEEDVVKNFFKYKEKRDQLIYIRLSGEDLPEQYVALYGHYPNEEAARSELAQMSLGLPESVKPQVKAFSDYVPYVNDMGSEESTSSAKVYAVRLNAVPLPRLDDLMVEELRRARQQATRASAQTNPRPAETRAKSASEATDEKRSQSGASVLTQDEVRQQSN